MKQENAGWSRREFIVKLATVGTMAYTGLHAKPFEKKSKEIVFPKLPYETYALKPYLSPATLELHYMSHHKKYVDTLNELIKGTDVEGKSLEEIIKASVHAQENQSIYENALHAWNHDFYWHSMRPGGGGIPHESLLIRMEKDFGDFKRFEKQFIDTCLKGVHGWTWLVLNNGKMEVWRSHYVDTPMLHNMKPLANIDLWEHAFYLDYRDRFDDYVRAFLNHLVNWEFVEKGLA